MKKLKLLLLLAVLLIPLWLIYFTISEPVIGIIVERDKGGDWVIDKFDTRNMAFKYDLRIGDVIKEVNGSDPSTFSSIIKWKTLDQAKTLLAAREEKEFEVSFKSESFYSSNDLLSISVSFFSLFIAYMLYIKMPMSRSAQYLSLVLLNIGITFLSLSASTRGDALGKICISVLIILIPITFLHFFIVFLKEKGNIEISTKFLKYLYIFAGCNFVATLSYFTTSEVTYYIYQFISKEIMLSFVIGLVGNFFFLIWMYTKYRKQQTYVSTIIKSVWVALIISFSPIISFSFIPQIIRGYPIVDPFVMGWFVFFLPLTFAYLIITKRLYDIDVVLRRILLAAVISILPSGLFVGIIRVVLPHEATAERLLVIFILFVGIFTFILYSFEYFTTKLEPVMFPRKYQLQSGLGNISKRLGSITSFRGLKEIILVDLVNTLQVFGGAIALKYKHNDSIEVISHGDINVEEVELLITSGDLEHEEYSCFEINEQEEYTSYLIMTQKKTMTLLGTEERNWLSLIITYLAVSLENVHLIRKLTMKLQQLASNMPNEQVATDFVWFRKLMFELQEKERVRIATELHDTTMQDLFFFKERLHSLLEKYMFSSADQAKMINMIEYIDVINSNLRQSCFELHPYLLKEVGLIQTIEKLFDFEMAVSPFELELDAKNAYQIEQWDLDRKLHIFRMIQELINNAKKHSRASRVKVTLICARQMMVLSYEDDGRGFDSNHTAVREIGSSGIGIEQMKSRVLSLNGLFELSTSKGNGMKLAVTLPMKEGQVA